MMTLPNPLGKIALAALLLAAVRIPAQTANTAQQLAFAGLRSVAQQGQLNGVQTDAAGNLYLLLDQKDGVRVLKTDNGAQNILAQVLLGAAGDSGTALALDPAGNVYVTGTTTSASFAATAGAAIPNRTDSSTQSFVAKFSSTLTTTFVTYTGGSRISATALSATADSVFVTGVIYGSNLPVTANGIQQSPAYNSTQNGFVERFSASGATLTYATYLTGASGDTTPAAIVADSADNAYLAGFTTATGFPTVAALIPNAVSNPSGFLAKLTPAGDAFTFSTFIPGQGLTSLVLDSTAKNLLASGSVALGQFPVDQAAFPLTLANYQVLLRIPVDGQSVTNATVLAPGTQSAVAAAPNGGAWVDGTFTAPLLPFPALAEEGSAFALRVTSAGIVDQTARLGGLAVNNPAYSSLPPTITSIAVDPAGEPLIAGAMQPTTSTSLLATQTYDLPLRPTGVFASTLKDAEPNAAQCNGVCSGFAAYLAKLIPTSGAAPTLAAADLPFVTVRNLGSATATGVAFATTSGNATTDCPTTLAPGQVCSLLLSGGQAGTLTVTSNGTPQALAYPAYSAPANTLAVHPRALDFGIVTSTSGTQTRTVTVYNPGTTAQTFSSSGVSPFSQFSTDCTLASGKLTLAAGGTCHVTFAFSPSSSSASDGPAAGYWNLGTRAISLTGYSQAASLGVSETEIDFGTQFTNGVKLPRYVYLSNSATFSVSHTAASLAASTHFAVTDGCPATLLPATVCRIRVDYNNTTAPASDSATLALDNGLSVVVTGQTLPPRTATGATVNPSLVVTPASLAFDATAVTGVSATQNVSVMNSGASPFTVAIAISGDFAQTNSCPASLAGGATCAVAVTFVPGSSGTRTGLLSITANSGTSPAYVSLTGTGTAVISTTNNAIDSGSSPVGEPISQFLKIALPFASLSATTTGPYTVALVEDNGSSHPTPAANAYSTSLKSACRNCYLALRFTPTAAGSQPGSLTLSSASAGTPQVITLTGTGLALSGLLLSPAAQDFGGVALHSTSGTYLFTLTNATFPAQTVTLTGPTFTGDFQQSTDPTGAQACTGTLAYGSACEFYATFSPTTTGTRTGTVTVAGSGFTASAALSGTATADTGIALSPTSLTFTNVSGPTATQQQVRVTNTGPTAATVGVPATTSSAFAAVTACGTLAPAGSCTISVTYTPGNGPVYSSLSIPVATGTTTTSYTVLLYGTYTSASAGLQIVPSVATFGPASVGTQGSSRTYTVNNLTARQLAVNVVIPRQYLLTSAPCTTLAPSGSCSLTLALLPLNNGEIAGSILVQASDSAGTLAGVAYAEGFGTGTATLQLSGALIANGAYNFGQVASGSSATQKFTITNTSAIVMTVRRVTSAPPFLATTTCGTTLAPSATCTLSITYTPSNQVASGSSGTAAPDAGTLAIESDASSSPDTLALNGQAGAVSSSNPTNNVPLATYTLSQSSLSFASTAVGNSSAIQSVTLTNTGSATLHVSSVFSTSDFAASSNCATVQPGATCTLQVSETPQASGTHIASTEILSDSTTSLEFLSVYGVATPAPLTITPTALNFGTVNVGQSSILPVQVTNSGTAPVTFASVSASGDYSAAGSCSGVLAPAQSCTVQVTFTPTTVGGRTGTLSIASSATTNPLTVSLTGNGVQSRLLVNPGALAFGSVVTGVAANQTLTLTNTGSAPITNVALAAAGDYSVSMPCALATLAPGTSCSAQITFTPTATGARNGTLTVTSSDPSSPLSVPLTGTGIAPGSFTLQVEGANSATMSTRSGQPAIFHVTVTPVNNFSGNVALTCAPVLPAQYASCSIAPAALTLAGTAQVAIVTLNTITSATAATHPILAAGTLPNLPDDLPVKRFLVAFLLLPSLLMIRRRRLPALLALLLTAFALTTQGCGGNSGDPSARYTPAGTYQYTITASSTSGTVITQTVTLNLNVTSR